MRLRFIKKIFLILMALTAFGIFCPKSYASTETENIALLTKKGFFDNSQQSMFINPCEEVRRTLYLHLKYANNYNLNGLKSLYAPKYMTSDGFSSENYFELIQKTWASYPDIKYKINIQNIEINQNTAIAQVSEDAIALTDSKSGIINERGVLQSTSTNVYYLEKINNEWLITSDYIIFEKTSLKYGSARDIKIDLTAPYQIPADTQYTVSLKMEAPKDSLIIASIGQENTTYPQIVAEEVFRKFPDDGILERVFKSNDKNINEYAVASFGITKAELKKGTEIKVYVTGIGFIMSRVNVIPKNNFIEVAKK